MAHHGAAENRFTSENTATVVNQYAVLDRIEVPPAVAWFDKEDSLKSLRSRQEDQNIDARSLSLVSPVSDDVRKH